MIKFIKKLFKPKPIETYTATTKWTPVFGCDCGFTKMLYEFPDTKNIVCPDCGKVHLDVKIIAGRRTRVMEMGAKYYPDNLISETWEIQNEN